MHTVISNTSNNNLYHLILNGGLVCMYRCNAIYARMNMKYQSVYPSLEMELPMSSN